MLFFIIFWKKTLMIDNVTHDTMTLCCYIIIEKKANISIVIHVSMTQNE